MSRVWTWIPGTKEQQGTPTKKKKKKERFRVAHHFSPFPLLLFLTSILLGNQRLVYRQNCGVWTTDPRRWHHPQPDRDRDRGRL